MSSSNTRDTVPPGRVLCTPLGTLSLAQGYSVHVEQCGEQLVTAGRCQYLSRAHYQLQKRHLVLL